MLCLHCSDSPAKTRPSFMEGIVGGHTYAACPSYLLRDGKPFLYRMGEFHHSRYPASMWRQELLKMKEGGIQVVASYMFWMHNECQEGIFDFSGSCDVRKFIDLCEELGMPFWLRIGPWAHGEARNGGFPDWLKEKCPRLRCMDETYLSYVRRYFTEIYRQVGTSQNILGIQVENELTDKPEYLDALHTMLREIGFTAPFWSATAWGSAKLPEGLLPMYGGYPEAPWTEHCRKLDADANANFFFSAQREDGIIGADLLNYAEGAASYDPYNGKYPFLTCELGGGNQATYHRRPLVSASDIGALAVCKLGSGANGLGYYMYHGGRNPVFRGENGQRITTQECRAAGDLNDYPIVSYDFQSPLGDCGQVRESYTVLQMIHRFLDVEGQTLAPMQSFFPETMPTGLSDEVTARVSVRSDGKRGFVFFNNHQHTTTLPAKKETLLLHLTDGALELPLELPSDSYGIIPFRYPVGTTVLNWVTAMPVERDGAHIVFAVLPGIAPKACLADGTIIDLSDGVSLGGLRVALCNSSKKPEQTLLSVPVQKTPNRMDFSCFSYIEPQWTRRLQDLTCEYTVSVPEQATYLLVQAKGNIGCCFDAEGTLLSDHYLDGDFWVIDVQGHTDVILKIQPLTKEDTAGIFFETEMPFGESLPQVWATTAPTVFL